MYSVLIVDDEEPVLESYSYMIERGAPDFSVCGKARSGEEAIEMIFRHKPQVVFMDIAMPGKDGLSVIESMHKTFSETIFVLSTAFERFDLAQRAVPLGVFAYLVKPVTKKIFLKTLADIKDALEKRLNTQEVVFQKKQLFLTETLHRSYTNDEWNEAKNLFGFTKSKFCVALIQGTKEQQKQLLKQMSYKYKIFESEYLSLMQLLFPLSINQFEQIQKDLKNICSKPDNSKSLIFGLGNPYNGNQLFLSAEEAFKNLMTQKQADFKREQFLIKEFLHSFKSSNRTPEKTYEALVQHIFAGEKLEKARFTLCGIFMILQEQLFAVYSDNKIKEQALCISDEFVSLKTKEDCIKWGKNALKLFKTEFQNQEKQKYPKTLEKALEYIDNHFSEPLSLKDVSSICGVSETHLSHLFSEHLRTGFSSYISEKRIAKAKELLLTQMSIKEISAETGFQDQNYFTRIFKKNIGLTPSEFRANSNTAKK
ncbi:MAG: helix-turn-helix domain-containing protein [Treponema sp.]|jgi:two-component system response regulator YesN|nr:helix-turn-helix domain-containing protein [Treponema sp.]